MKLSIQCYCEIYGNKYYEFEALFLATPWRGGGANLEKLVSILCENVLHKEYIFPHLSIQFNTKFTQILLAGISLLSLVLVSVELGHTMVYSVTSYNSVFT